MEIKSHGEQLLSLPLLLSSMVFYAAKYADTYTYINICILIYV